jgi:hypothetical protein
MEYSGFQTIMVFEGYSMYRTIDTSTWADPKVKRLDSTGKLLFIYFITNSHTHVSGIYYLPRVFAQYESGVSDNLYYTLCDTLTELTLVNFDDDREIVWVENMFRYQGRGKKNVISASMHLKTLHGSILCDRFASKYPAVLEVKNGYRIIYPIDTLCDRGSEGGPSGTGAGTVFKAGYPSKKKQDIVN